MERSSKHCRIWPLNIHPMDSESCLRIYADQVKDGTTRRYIGFTSFKSSTRSAKAKEIPNKNCPSKGVLTIWVLCSVLQFYNLFFWWSLGYERITNPAKILHLLLLRLSHTPETDFTSNFFLKGFFHDSLTAGSTRSTRVPRRWHPVRLDFTTNFLPTPWNRW